MTQKLLSKRAVSDILGVHEATIMRLVRERKFPQPLRTGNVGSAVRWRQVDVQDWIDARIAKIEHVDPDSVRTRKDARSAAQTKGGAQ